MLGSEQAPTIGEWLPGILFWATMITLALTILVDIGKVVAKRLYRKGN
jgi:hypothetical protein